MDPVHGEEFYCPIDGCAKVFETRLALAKQKKKRKKTLACDRCSSSFVEEKFLLSHKSKYHEKAPIARNFCLQCEKQFDNCGKLQSHINETHNKKIKI